MLFSIHILQFCFVLPGIYLRRNIHVTNGKELNTAVNKLCSVCSRGQRVNVERNEANEDQKRARKRKVC